MTTTERTETTSADPTGTEPAHRWTRPTRPAVVSALLLALLSALLVTVNVSVSPGISPNDETTHADYALRVAQGTLPAAGDTIAPEILAEWACRQGADPNRVLPACSDGPYDPRVFPAKGLQYNADHPPLYYAVTALGAEAIGAVTGEAFLQAARLTGVGWLTAGLWVLLAALRRLRVPWTTATAVAAVVALSPSVAYPSSTVTNDAAALLAGSLALWVALRVVQGDSSWLAFAATAAVVTGLKILFAAALVPAGVVIALHLLRHGAERRRLLGVLGAGVLSATATAVGWRQIQSGRGDPDFVNPVLGFNTRPADEFPWASLVGDLLDTWPPIGGPFLYPELQEPAVALWVGLVALLASAAPFVATAAGRHVTGRDVGIGAALGLVSVPLFVQAATFSTSGHVFADIAPRYGLALVPALALAFAHALRGRRASISAVVLAVLGALTLTTVLALA